MTAAPALREVSLSLGGRTVLDNVTFEPSPRSVTVLRGPSGAGKSTVLNLLKGYQTPDTGTVTTDPSAAYLFQEELLFSQLTARQNLEMRPGTTSSVSADQALELLGISAQAEVPAGQLSGGERRRLELAAVLRTPTEVLLLDEPTTGLDPETSREVLSEVWRRFADLTVILVTHEVQVPGLPAGARELRLEAGQIR